MAAVLTWIKSRKAFLKIQVGSGDNLSEEDLDEGMVDYVLWSTFRPMDIDTDSELEMRSLDSGMLMDNKPMTARDVIPDCYLQAFNITCDDNDVVVLMEEE